MNKFLERWERLTWCIWILMWAIAIFAISSKVFAYTKNSVTDIPEMRTLEMEACLKLEQETLLTQINKSSVNSGTYQTVHDKMSDHVYHNVLAKIFENASKGVQYRDISQAQVIAMSKVAYGFGYYSGKKTCKNLVAR